MIQIHVNPGDCRPVDAAALQDAIHRTLAEEGIGVAEISLTLLPDSDIRRLNREYLDRDVVTDVIAFALYDEGEPVLGDVYVGHDQALRQAQALGIDPAEELLRLSVHGTLHVLGHDHPDGEERNLSPMFRRQEEIVRLLLDSGP